MKLLRKLMKMSLDFMTKLLSEFIRSRTQDSKNKLIQKIVFL